MSFLDSLSSALATMGGAQLLSAMVAAIGYALALNDSLAARARLIAAGTALIAAVMFSVLTPSWISGVLLMMLSVVGVGAFATLAWLLTRVLGLRDGIVHEVEAIAPPPSRATQAMALPMPAFSAETSPHPL